MRLLRSIFRRKLRAYLTIFGITIGVLTLVVMGAVGEKLTLVVDGMGARYAGKVTVSSTGGLGRLLPTRKRLDVERVPGVASVSANVWSVLEDGSSLIGSLSSLSSIQANDGREKDYESSSLRMAEGRMVLNADRDAIALGADAAKMFDASPGDTVEIHGKDRLVVGILDTTMTFPDTAVYMPLHDAQHVVYDDLPAEDRATVTPESIVSVFVVYPRPGVDAQTLARNIERRVPGLDASGPADYQKETVAPMQMLVSLIYAIGVIALLVGGLSVINTMTMAVSERTREIGIRKAIGASDAQILAQFVSESAVLGLIGGLTGLLLGALVAHSGNAAGAANGTQMFMLTPRLAIGSVAFALILSVLSGLYPAYRAASLNPVVALRHE